MQNHRVVGEMHRRECEIRDQDIGQSVAERAKQFERNGIVETRNFGLSQSDSAVYLAKVSEEQRKIFDPFEQLRFER